MDYELAEGGDPCAPVGPFPAPAPEPVPARAAAALPAAVAGSAGAFEFNGLKAAPAPEAEVLEDVLVLGWCPDANRWSSAFSAIALQKMGKCGGDRRDGEEEK